jgi:hypothetical protein
MNTLVKRGGLLTAYLVLCFVGAVATAIAFLVHWDQMTATWPAWAILILRTVVFLRPFSVVAIWLWSRSGVVIYISLSVLSALVFLQLGDASRAARCLGLIIMIALIWTKWRYMIWGISTSSRVEASEVADA